MLDPNGEYTNSFNGLANVRVYGAEPNEEQGIKQLVVPMWLWNTAEWVAFTQASGKAQKPTLCLLYTSLAYEGNTELIDDKLNTTRSIDDIFKSAQRAFNTWSKWEPEERTTENLLRMLDFDFFEVLDSVTIARSRKHIQKYYDTTDIGTFPTRRCV